MSRSSGRRVMAVWLPRLPLDRLARVGQPGADGLFAVTREARSAVRLAVLSDEAEAAGLTVGMTLADARAVASELVTVPEDPGRDAQLLASLQRYCGRYTPASARDGADGLVLDVTGCTHLFGGEAAMTERVATDFEGLGIEARIALAETTGAARAIARWGVPDGARSRIVRSGETRTALAPLPCEAVALPNDAVTMRRLGLPTVGDLCGVRSAQLARRFGLDLVERLEAVLGQRPDPVTPEKALPAFRARMSFPDPIGLEEDVAAGVAKLAAQLCVRLAEARYGTRAVRLEIHRADRTTERIDVGMALPTREPDFILRQVRPRLARLDARTGIDMLRLEAIEAEPHTGAQHGLAREAVAAGDIAGLIATLGNKVGFDRVRAFGVSDSHLPERGVVMVPAHEAAVLPTEGEAARPRPPRPMRAVPLERAEVTEPGRPPRAFRWRGQAYRSRLAEGPERVAPEWWRDEDDWGGRSRDYWRVQTEEGERLWLATASASQTPDWYVAGVFA